MPRIDPRKQALNDLQFRYSEVESKLRKLNALPKPLHPRDAKDLEQIQAALPKLHAQIVALQT
jgi:hypothetical protein